MPQYVAIIYSKDVDWSLPEQAGDMAEYGAFGEAAAAVIRGGAALYPHCHSHDGPGVGR